MSIILKLDTAEQRQYFGHDEVDLDQLPPGIDVDFIFVNPGHPLKLVYERLPGRYWMEADRLRMAYERDYPGKAALIPILFKIEHGLPAAP